MIAVAVQASSVFGISAFAADGQVYFTGEIIYADFDVINTPSNSLEVKLGNVARSAFIQAGFTEPMAAGALLMGCTARRHAIPKGLKHIFIRVTDTHRSLVLSEVIIIIVFIVMNRVIYVAR